MKNKQRLSNSAIDVYKSCSMKYRFHYIDKIRPTCISSALVFGKSIDNALNIILLQKKKVLTEEEQQMLTRDPKQVFDSEFEMADINGEVVNIIISPQISYYAKDLDVTLLQDEDYEKLATAELGDLLISRQNIVEFESDCAEMRKNKMPLKGDMLLMHNFICWMSLRRKAHLMIDAYQEQIMPRIEEVHEIQKEIRLESPNGDYIIGFIDLIATIDGVKYILDNKTASAPYKQDAVVNSQQLAIYSESQGIRHCGYIVLNKKLRIKHPRVPTQIILGEIPESLLENVFDTIGNVGYNIEEGNFEKNLDSCFSYGRKCDYFSYCRDPYGLNMEGLTQLEDKDKK